MTNKMDKMIMAVPTYKLLDDNYFQGFKNSDEFDYQSIILDNYEFIRRGDAEIDPSFKQPIGYCAIVNPNDKTVFVYQRASNEKDYSEARLHGKYSWGVGGHIEMSEDGSSNPIFDSLLRELDEEVQMHPISDPKVIGYINDDSNEVGKVHFGVLYVIETDKAVNPGDGEIVTCKFMDIDEMEQICNNPDVKVEEWSKIALAPIRKYFDSL